MRQSGAISSQICGAAPSRGQSLPCRTKKSKPNRKATTSINVQKMFSGLKKQAKLPRLLAGSWVKSHSHASSSFPFSLNVPDSPSTCLILYSFAGLLSVAHHHPHVKNLSFQLLSKCVTCWQTHVLSVERAISH